MFKALQLIEPVECYFEQSRLRLDLLDHEEALAVRMEVVVLVIALIASARTVLTPEQPYRSPFPVSTPLPEERQVHSGLVDMQQHFKKLRPK